MCAVTKLCYVMLCYARGRGSSHASAMLRASDDGHARATVRCYVRSHKVMLCYVMLRARARLQPRECHAAGERRWAREGHSALLRAQSQSYAMLCYVTREGAAPATRVPC